MKVIEADGLLHIAILYDGMGPPNTGRFYTAFCIDADAMFAHQVHTLKDLQQGHTVLRRWAPECVVEGFPTCIRCMA